MLPSTLPSFWDSVCVSRQIPKVKVTCQVQQIIQGERFWVLFWVVIFICSPVVYVLFSVFYWWFKSKSRFTLFLKWYTHARTNERTHERTHTRTHTHTHCNKDQILTFKWYAPTTGKQPNACNIGLKSTWYSLNHINSDSKVKWCNCKQINSSTKNT